MSRNAAVLHAPHEQGPPSAQPAHRASRRPGYARPGLILFKVALVILIPLGGALTGPQGGRTAHGAVYVMLLAWALRGPRQAIEALSLSWLLTFLNPGLFYVSGMSEVLRWLVVAAALGTMVLRLLLREATLPRAWFWVLGFVVTGSSLAVHTSYALDVSLFKLVSFFMGASAVLLGFHFTRHEGAYWRSWFFILFAAVVVIGFPLIVHPLGYTRNGRGFQGLTGQPQTYTLLLGPFNAWLFAQLVTRRERRTSVWLLLGIGVVSLIATGGRTGVVAAVAGLGIAAVWWAITGRVRVALPRPWIALALLAMAAGGIWVARDLDSATRSTMDFLFKGRAEAGLDKAFYASRGFLIEASMENFRQNPMTGIGFGLASDPASLIVKRDPLLGLPTGASVEKGFTAVAVLEEVGVLGTAVFLMMLAALMRPVFARGARFPAAVLALSALMLNFGEGIFFALGGSGMLVWLLIGAGRVMAASDE